MASTRCPCVNHSNYVSVRKENIEFREEICLLRLQLLRREMGIETGKESKDAIHKKFTLFEKELNGLTSKQKEIVADLDRLRQNAAQANSGIQLRGSRDDQTHSQLAEEKRKNEILQQEIIELRKRKVWNPERCPLKHIAVQTDAEIHFREVNEDEIHSQLLAREEKTKTDVMQTEIIKLKKLIEVTHRSIVLQRLWFEISERLQTESPKTSADVECFESYFLKLGELSSKINVLLMTEFITGDQTPILRELQLNVEKMKQLKVIRPSIEGMEKPKVVSFARSKQTDEWIVAMAVSLMILLLTYLVYRCVSTAYVNLFY